LSKYSAELDDRDEDDDDPAAAAERRGVGGAKSIVASSPLLLAGAPQAEQKRTLSEIPVPQEVQVGIIFPETVYRVRTELVPPCRQTAKCPLETTLLTANYPRTPRRDAISWPQAT
jgi:hypothetical protein